MHRGNAPVCRQCAEAQHEQSPEVAVVCFKRPGNFALSFDEWTFANANDQLIVLGLVAIFPQNHLRDLGQIDQFTKGTHHGMTPSGDFGSAALVVILTLGFLGGGCPTGSDSPTVFMLVLSLCDHRSSLPFDLLCESVLGEHLPSSGQSLQA